MAADDTFDAFVEQAGLRLQRALKASYGPEVGGEAAAEALSWAWEHWSRVQAMANPVGYLYRVGQSRARRYRFRWIGTSAPEGHEQGHPPFDLDLEAALGRLTPHQRSAVLLVHGYGYTLAEAAEVVGCSISTLRNHIRRGLDKLHDELEDSHAHAR